jgi:Protein of unknown function (DUF3892)
MAGTCYITAVRLEYPLAASHPHIGWVRLSDGTVETRGQVIQYINQGRIYLTHASNVPQARVIVMDCPMCGSGDYIAAEPDWTEQNNLLHLPKFWATSSGGIATSTIRRGDR